MKRKTYVYALIDPITNQCRYVGKTVNLENRYCRHCNPSNDNKTHVACWERSLIPLKPEMIILEEVYEDWIEAEQFWIAYFKFLGFNLTNHSIGGEGVLGIKVSDETRNKMSNTRKGWSGKWRKGSKLSEEHKEIIRKSNTGRKHSDEIRARISSSQKGKVIPEEQRRKISVATKAAMNTPEMFERMSKARKGRIPYNKGKRDIPEDFFSNVQLINW